MPSLTEWRVPPAYQPRPGDYSFDLDRVLSSVVGLHSIIPPDAFTAETLGTERAGNGVVIDDGLVLTIGYLITEAEAVWLHLGDGRAVEGHALGFDSVTGFGLVQALGRIDLDPLPLGSSAAARVGDHVVVGGAGGRTRSVASQIAARQEFAGYWEYLLDDAIFTYPAHPNWGGTGLISASGELIGISGDGPAARAELKAGDVILAVNGEEVTSQSAFYRKLWALGPAGVDVPLTVHHEGVTFDVVLASTDRAKLLKAPQLH